MREFETPSVDKPWDRPFFINKRMPDIFFVFFGTFTKHIILIQRNVLFQARKYSPDNSGCVVLYILHLFEELGAFLKNAIFSLRLQKKDHGQTIS